MAEVQLTRGMGLSDSWSSLFFHTERPGDETHPHVAHDLEGPSAVHITLTQQGSCCSQTTLLLGQKPSYLPAAGCVLSRNSYRLTASRVP